MLTWIYYTVFCAIRFDSLIISHFIRMKRRIILDFLSFLILGSTIFIWQRLWMVQEPCRRF
uniref:Uncharacterized protein n=1 Tax=Arundo donax TaxID=35708 RepID=A0A0A8ZV74_ARUDO